MSDSQSFILGEFHRTLDERFRVTIPTELMGELKAEDSECFLAKERPGCVSLWNSRHWQAKLDDGIDLVKRKMQSGRLDGRIAQVQLLGRLLSTRHRPVELGARGRLLIPEGFREFLGVEPGGEVLIVGAGVCVEIWNPSRWLNYLEQRMPKFRRLFDKLAD